MDIQLALSLDFTRFAPLIFVMAYAAYADYKTGLVSNKFWLYGIIGGALTIIETALFFSIGLLIFTVMVIIGCFITGLVTFKIGGGGADSKAFMVIGVSAPLVPWWSAIWPIPMPFLAMLIAALLVLPYMVFEKSDIPIDKRKIRFLPFLFIGLVVSVIL